MIKRINIALALLLLPLMVSGRSDVSLPGDDEEGNGEIPTECHWSMNGPPEAKSSVDGENSDDGDEEGVIGV